MSAAGRSERGGGGYDYFPTPHWPVHRLLDDCGEHLLPLGGTALEPTCGDGAIIEACETWRGGGRGTIWTGVELRENALRSEVRPLLTHHHEGVDFRSWCSPVTQDLTIGNPPFTLAEAIIRHSLSMSRVVAMLLRVSFFGAEERTDFFRGIGADPALRALPERPSFDGIGTDASTYAWFVWGSPNIRGNRYLKPTPVEVRKAQTPQGLVFNARQQKLW